MLASLPFWDYFTIGMYLVAVIGIGVWFSKKEDTSEEYLLGGRKMNWMAVGISYMMSLLSTFSLVMVPGEIFSHGLTMWSLELAAPFFSIIAFFIFTRFYFKMGVFTPYEYLGVRYGESVRILVSVQYLWARIMYLGIVLFSMSIIFKSAIGWQPWVTILVIGTVGVVYTVMGGLKAVIWTDVLQFVILIVGLLLAAGICIYKINGGLPAIISISFENGRGLSEYAQPSFYTMNPYVRLCFWLLLMGPLTGALNQATFDQVSVQRLLSTGSVIKAQKSIFLNAGLALPFSVLLWIVGFGMFVFYHQNPDPSVTSGDGALFKFISTELPTPLPGLLLATMLAAAMSTLDSGLNSLSTVLVKEFYLRYINKGATEKKQVSVSRWLVVIIGTFAVGLGVASSLSSETFGQSLAEVGTIFGILGVVMLPAFVFAVFSERVTSAIIWLVAALCWGMNTGGVHWYSASNRVENALVGAISFSYVTIPLIIAAVFIVLSLLIHKLQRKLLSQILTGFWLFFIGYASMILFWYLTARYTGGGKLSFQWPGTPGFVGFFIFGAIAIKIWGRRPDPKRYMGLTMSTIKENILE